MFFQSGLGRLAVTNNDHGGAIFEFQVSAGCAHNILPMLAAKDEI